MKRIKEHVSFEVAPYALYDVMRALEIQNNNNLYEYYEKGVTKQDGHLVVWVTKEYLSKPTDEKCCAAPVEKKGETNDVL